jgi:chromosomal replication initiation ATPase DnaA
VEGGLAESDEDMQKLVRGSPLGIGAGEFLDGLKAGVRALRGVRVKEEDIALRRELAQVPTEDILEMVCKELRIEQGELIRRKRGNWRRSLTAYLLQKHGGLTQREVAGILGLKTGSAVSVEVRQFKAGWMRRRDCVRALERIERQL